MSLIKKYCLEVEGKYALFTNPALKVERFSYPIITPSSIRSIFEAIFWKPQIRWEPSKIEVLNEIKYVTFFRNEIKNKQSNRSENIFIENDRTQRRSTILKDVKYRLHCNMFLNEININYDLVKGIDLHLKYINQFESRAKVGGFFNQPYLGCREFFAKYKLITDFENLQAPINQSNEYGINFYDFDYKNNYKQMYYNCSMNNGIINIPGQQGVLK